MLDKLCDKIWLYIMYAVGAVIAVLFLIYWNDWEYGFKLLLSFGILIPLHVLEEWQLPGGFHYQYNAFHKSDVRDCYPMNRLSDMLTNSLAEIMFIGFALFGSNVTGIYLGMSIFSLLEVIVHSALGANMLKELKAKGKRTIYGPGSITAYFAFGPLCVLCFLHALKKGIGWGDLLVALIVLAAICVILIFIPENSLKSKTSKYPYKSAGYFDRF